MAALTSVPGWRKVSGREGATVWPAGRLRLRACFGIAGMLVATLLAGTTPAAAQFSAVAGAGAHAQHFSMMDADAAGFESLSLFSVPVSGRANLTRTVRLEAVTSYAHASLTDARGTTTVAGLTDTHLRVLADLLDGRVTVTGNVALPTGADGFTSDEMRLAGLMAADLLPFRVSAWGAGGGMGGTVNFFDTFGDLGLGLTAGYTVPGEYDPVDQEAFRYRPGPALLLQAAVDRTVGEAGKASLLVAYRRFGEDEVEGRNLFRSGDRVHGRASYSFAAGATGTAVLYAGYLHRSAGAFLQGAAERSSQGLLYAGGGLRRPWRGMVAVPSVDLRIQRSEDGVGQGVLGGVGLELEVPAGRHLIVPRAHLRGGTVRVRQGSESGVVGVEVGASLRHGGGQ